MRHDRYQPIRRSGPIRRPRLFRSALLAGALVAAARVAPATLRAGDDDPAQKTTTKKTTKKTTSKDHLEYRRTYEGALFEARIRNLPVFVSRHKDF